MAGHSGHCGTLTTLCLASLLASSTGFAVQPAVRTSPCVAFAGQALPLRVAPSTILADEAAASSDSEGPIKRIRAWFGKYAKVDKATLAKSGVDAFFTYGVVSNLNAGLTLSLAWGTFSRASGLSPLAPGQWKSFLAVYVGIYATLGTVLRPFRFALAIGLTPTYSDMISRVRGRLPFRDSNPKLNRSLALFLVSLLGNSVVTCAFIAFGVWFAGLVTGVPPFPPGFVLPWKAA